ncbi:MAG TPA: hypothetical protein DIT01_05000 [Lentisphaeria bacterium]|nr:hypothetical protein [Lentisphaeria bacterium]
MTSTTGFARTHVMPAIFCAALLSSAGDAAGLMPWKSGPDTREVENGTVLENDLLFVKGGVQLGPKYYPQVPVVDWEPVTQPGRYRVTLRARTEKLGASTLVLQALVSRAAGGLIIPTGYGPIPLADASVSMSGCVFDAPGRWQEFSLAFDVESGKPAKAGLMYVGDTTCDAGRVQVEKSSMKLEKLDLPVSISWARPVKLRYKHAEKAALDIRLTNATGEPQTVDVRPVVTTDTDQRIPGRAKRFTVPASATVSSTVPFVVPAEDGGYEAVGELLLDGQVIDQRGDVFAVSDSPFRCMIQGSGLFDVPYFLSSSGHLGLAGFKEKVMGNWDQYVKDTTLAIESSRRAYVTYYEYFAWAREDATFMTEETDELYLTGQTFYIVSRKQLLHVIRLMKAHGIAPVAYLNAIPFGWPGFEVIRIHPEWYRDTAFNTAIMEKYMNGEVVGGSVYPHIEMHFDVVSPFDGKTYLEYHIEQIVASAAQYGWEAFRYDAAPLSIEHFPIVKQVLAALDPPAGIGNNLGRSLLGPKPSDTWKIYCRDGSLMMDESIVMAFHSPTDPRRRWTDWIDYLRLASHMARSHGGHHTYINQSANWYSTALGYAVGGHPWSFYKSPFGDYERFMIRYGSYFWDLRTQMLPDPEKQVSVESGHPLWWKPLVSQRILDPQHRQIIVPLFNPPAEEEVVGTTSVGSADGVKVVLAPRPGEQVTAWLLAPEPVARRLELETKRMTDSDDGAGDRVQVTVPRFWGWTNVVFDCRTK